MAPSSVTHHEYHLFVANRDWVGKQTECLDRALARWLVGLAALANSRSDRANRSKSGPDWMGIHAKFTDQAGDILAW